MEKTLADTQRPLLAYPGARARLGGVSESTLARLIRHGEIPVVKIGGRGLIDPTDLDAFIQRQKRRRVA
jgi:excisionase family DNA binding protein